MSLDAPTNELIYTSNFDAFIFDLGGVILPLNYGATVKELSELLNIDASGIYTQAKQSDLFDQFERGEITAEEFRAALLQHAGVQKEVEASALDDAWNALLGSVPQEHLDFLRRLGASKRIFLLSNTNELHLSRFKSDFSRDHPQAGSFDELFERAYYSHEMGARKPEARIYKRLLEDHELDPGRTLFIDDNIDNVAGAKETGIVALRHLSNSSLPARFIWNEG